jgi:hydrogenase maturation protease
MKDLLIYGIGNPGRQDDGLGVEFVSLLERWSVEQIIKLQIDFLSNYQLNIEDAKTIADYELVVIADASKEIPEGYQIRRIDPVQTNHAMTHFLSPGALLRLCEELFGRKPQMYVLHLAGYRWSIGKPVTRKAKNNFQQALDKFQEIGIKVRSAGEMVNELKLLDSKT